jgi:hypothetical protein
VHCELTEHDQVCDGEDEGTSTNAGARGSVARSGRALVRGSDRWRTTVHRKPLRAIDDLAPAASARRRRDGWTSAVKRCGRGGFATWPRRTCPTTGSRRSCFEETTGTLLCGDLCSQTGNPRAVTSNNLVDAAIAAEHTFHATSLAPAVPATLRRLAELQPGTLAIMHAGRTAATAALPCGLLLTPTRRRC